MKNKKTQKRKSTSNKEKYTLNVYEVGSKFFREFLPKEIYYIK